MLVLFPFTYMLLVASRSAGSVSMTADSALGLNVMDMLPPIGLTPDMHGDDGPNNNPMDAVLPLRVSVPAVFLTPPLIFSAALAGFTVGCGKEAARIAPAVIVGVFECIIDVGLPAGM